MHVWCCGYSERLCSVHRSLRWMASAYLDGAANHDEVYERNLKRLEEVCVTVFHCSPQLIK